MDYIDIDIDIPEGFTIDSSAKADWAIETIKNEYARLEKYEETCDARIAEFQTKKTDQRAKVEAGLTGLKDMLMMWMQTAPTKKAKASESIALPSGTIRLHYAKQKMEPDRDKLAEYYHDTEYEIITCNVDWATLKKDLVIVDGEFVVNNTTGDIISDEYIKLVDVAPRLEVK